MSAARGGAGDVRSADHVTGMTPQDEEILLRIAASPHVHSPHSTPRIMWTVTATLVPLVAAAAWWFGPSALLVIGAATAGAVLTERLFGRRGALGDGSAAITGILLGLILPAGFPMWMAFVGGAFGIGFGKLIFGGLGQNVFNPALLGRAFLQAAFPTAITTWPADTASWWALRGDNFAWPLMSPETADLVTAATPLGAWKFEGVETQLADLLIGRTGGSLGETSGLLILALGVFLALKKYLDWRIPASILATVALFSALLHLLDPVRYAGPMFMLFSGGLMIGAVYMATDMVTSPVTPRGAWIYGIGIGLLVVLIRVWGGLPEGVMYAILLMNAMVPFINRATQPRVFGHERKQREAAA
ncbi:MAG: RnfABCDGE type electron transport complex subunit D [marine benthic group bacterium]|nr:RnfABCDGE type electron transport complex subunit D [Gemmatimonadota bacterium]MCL7973315.1 RnfABCDGE type electron transport complex subunit D [Gemmatimonadota bacterium]MCL7977154.1 RnfABCDGE type electron transport complex subunit D [Gemmatimonadota bacterium]